MTKIEWTDATWNPTIGCSRISKECDRCYAATAAASPRLQQFPQ
jgi:protein gp37